MKYNIKYKSQEWYAICECMDINNKCLPEPTNVDYENHCSIYDIQFVVGGVELDFTKILNRLYSKHEEYVINEAKEIVENKYGELFREVENLKEKIECLTSKTNEDWD